MRDHSTVWEMCILLLVFCGTALSQSQHKIRTLEINGHTGEASVFEIDRRSYVDLEALVRITNGTMRFEGERIILTLPPAPEPTRHAEVPSHSDDQMSGEFMRTSVQELAALKEWVNVLTYAAQRGVPGDGSRIVIQRDRAVEALRLAKVGASTSADTQSLQLLTNLFNAVNDWSDKLIRERKAMDTGKYSINPDALTNDPGYQKIATCMRFLSNMIPSGRFEDESSCR